MPNLQRPKGPRAAKAGEPSDAQGMFFSGSGELSIVVQGGQLYVDFELGQGAAYAWIADFDDASTPVNPGVGTYPVDQTGGLLTVVFINAVGGLMWGVPG